MRCLWFGSFSDGPFPNGTGRWVGCQSGIPISSDIHIYGRDACTVSVVPMPSTRRPSASRKKQRSWTSPDRSLR
jgi:hypothetical protein